MSSMSRSLGIIYQKPTIKQENSPTFPTPKNPKIIFQTIFFYKFLNRLRYGFLNNKYSIIEKRIRYSNIKLFKLLRKYEINLEIVFLNPNFWWCFFMKNFWVGCLVFYKNLFSQNFENLCTKFVYFGIDKKFIKMMHVVYETLPQLNMKFCWYFAHFFVYRFKCVSELFIISKKISMKI